MAASASHRYPFQFCFSVREVHGECLVPSSGNIIKLPPLDYFHYPQTLPTTRRVVPLYFISSIIVSKTGPSCLIMVSFLILTFSLIYYMTGFIWYTQDIRYYFPSNLILAFQDFIKNICQNNKK